MSRTNRFWKKTTLPDEINTNFRAKGSRNPQAIRILSRHHKRIIWNTKIHKYYVHGIARYDNGRFDGFGWSQKERKLSY